MTGSVDLVNSYLDCGLPPVCRTGRTLCAIYVQVDPFSNHPAAISANILYYIGDGIANGGPQPKFPFNAKKYVYFFP